jgi:hypothetical protein
MRYTEELSPDAPIPRPVFDGKRFRVEDVVYRVMADAGTPAIYPMQFFQSMLKDGGLPNGVRGNANVRVVLVEVEA